MKEQVSRESQYLQGIILLHSRGLGTVVPLSFLRKLGLKEFSKALGKTGVSELDPARQRWYALLTQDS